MIDSNISSGPVAPIIVNGWPENIAYTVPQIAPESSISIVPYTASKSKQTTKPIEMSFGVVTRVGPRNHVLDRPYLSSGRGILGAKWRPIIKYRDTLR